MEKGHIGNHQDHQGNKVPSLRRIATLILSKVSTKLFLHQSSTFFYLPQNKFSFGNLWPSLLRPAEALADVLEEEQTLRSDPELKAGIGLDGLSSLSSTSSIYTSPPSTSIYTQQELAMSKGPLPSSHQTLLSERPLMKEDHL